MQSIGKTLQIVGLIIPPLSIVSQLSNSITAKQMLVFLVAAACLFWIGRILEGFGQKRQK